MLASATHSLRQRPEHWPKRVPLVRTLLDEILEPLDDALHEALLRVAFAHRQGGIEMDVVTTRRNRVLACRHQCRARLEGQGGGAARHDGMPPEESDVHAWTLLEVAEEGDDMVGAERLGDCPDGGTAEHDHIHSESLPCPQDSIVQRSRELFCDRGDRVTDRAGVSAGHVP